MKIDFIINSLSGGGAERVMATLANGFSRKNNISLITFNEGDAYQLDTEVRRVRLHHGKIKNHTIRSWVNLFTFYKNKSSRPDIIIVFMPANALIAIPIAKLFGIKIVVSEHNNHKANASRKSKWVRKILYPLVNAVTILTSYDLNFFKKMNKKVIIMPNPILVPAEISEFQNRKKNILAAGSLKRYQVKGFDILLKIAAPLLQTHKDWTLTIAGSGEDGMKVLQNISRELKIEEQVLFPGFCNNIQELMQNSQIFALPSKYEGLPMVLMEALSNGMSCIAYDCVSGPGDLIENQINGLLIDNQNSNAFRQELNDLLKNENLRNSLASKAPKSMLPYDLSKILIKWKILFNEIYNA